MRSIDYNSGRIRLCSMALAAGILAGLTINSSGHLSAQHLTASIASYAPRRMADGKQRTTINLSVNTIPSFCYDDSGMNCVRYGRLYDWESAR